MTTPPRTLLFEAIHEDAPGSKLATFFEGGWSSYRTWFLKEGDSARPTYAQCRRAMKEHMPELVPTWETLVDLAGGGDMAARFLSLWRPTPYLCGCSQAIWTRSDLALVRNYDYAHNACDGLVLRSAFTGRPTLAMADCVWGVLDGVNADGLAVALAFGGRKVVGEGFGVTLVLRYLLECAHTTGAAIELLKRVPMHMAYNVTLLDARGRYATVLVSPDRPAVVKHWTASTNHQERIEWPEYAASTQTLERKIHLESMLNEEDQTLHGVLERFGRPPLHRASYDRGWGTLYTSAYFPKRGAAEYRWPGHRWSLSFDDFAECTYEASYPDRTSPPPRPGVPTSIPDHHRQ